jgi:hypothetical protein
MPTPLVPEDKAIQFIGICSIGVQRLVESLDPVLDSIGKRVGSKKVVAIGLSLFLGTALSFFTEGGFFFSTAADTPARSLGQNLVISLINGLLIGGGTETFNSLIKMLGSAKSTTEALAGKPTASRRDAHMLAALAPDLPDFGRAPPT